MIRLLGGISIICGGLWFLWLRKVEHRKREETLCDMIAALQSVAEEIHHIATPLSDALEQAANRCRRDAKAFFQETAWASKCTETFSLSWKSCAEKLPVSRMEKQIIAQIGDGFSTNGINPCKAIMLSCEMLERSRKQWQQKQNETAKCEGALCLSAAALLVILLA